MSMGVSSWKNCQPTEKKVLGRRVINVFKKKTPPKHFEWGSQVYDLKEKVEPDLEISILGVKKIAKIVVYFRNELARIASANSEIQAADIEAAVNQLFPKQLAQGALQHAFEAMNYYQSQKDHNQPDNLLDKLDKLFDPVHDDDQADLFLEGEAF